MPVLSSDGLVVRAHPTREVFRATFATSSGATGKWYASAPSDTQEKLLSAYDLEPYPTDQQMDKLARAVRAPSKDCVRTFYACMHVKAQELCGHG